MGMLLRRHRGDSNGEGQAKSSDKSGSQTKKKSTKKKK